MAERVQKEKVSKKQEEKPAPVEAKDLSEKGAELNEALDDLMTEIDNVLEKNAAEFVANYVQRGGQ